jgi:hypothetical protein
MKDWLGWIRRSAPLLICFGIIFPWAVSPFGILSCSEKGSFLPESRFTLRQWLPMAATLDVAADHKEDPSSLGGFTERNLYYFDEIIIVGLVFGFLLLGLWRSFYPKAILAGILTGLLWTYLSLLLFLLYYFSGVTGGIWLQPGVLLISVGYLLLTIAGVIDFRCWILRGRKKIKNYK